MPNVVLETRQEYYPRAARPQSLIQSSNCKHPPMVDGVFVVHAHTLRWCLSKIWTTEALPRSSGFFLFFPLRVFSLGPTWSSPAKCYEGAWVKVCSQLFTFNCVHGERDVPGGITNVNQSCKLCSCIYYCLGSVTRECFATCFNVSVYDLRLVET